MGLKDKFKLSTDAELDLISRNLAQMIYTTGKFENLQASLLDTESILNNLPGTNAKPEDIVVIINLKRAYQFVLKLDGLLSYKDILTINNIVQGGSSTSGRLRTTDVRIRLTNEVWLPPVPDRDDVKNKIVGIITSKYSTTEKAISLNLYLSRNQLFTNGNKRTALVASNALMIQAKTGLLAIPENKMYGYQAQLVNYYRTNRYDQIKQWLYDNAVFGVN